MSANSIDNCSSICHLNILHDAKSSQSLWLYELKCNLKTTVCRENLLTTARLAVTMV